MNEYKHQRKHLFFLTLIVVFSLIVLSYDVMSWKYSFVGDEWSFFDRALEISKHNMLVNPFDMNGVYGEHRVLGSYWQAIFIILFSGNQVFGWHFSIIFLIVPITFSTYYFVRDHFSERTALIAALLINTSAHLMNFSKIPYLNLIAFALMLLCLQIASKAGRLQSIKWFGALGFLLGLSFYVYIGPLFSFIVWPYLIRDMKANWRKFCINLAVLVSVFVVVVGIGFITTPSEYWATALKKTVFYREFTNTNQVLLNIIRLHLAFFVKTDLINNHYVTGPLLDVITRLFVVLGAFICLVKMRHGPHILLLLTFSSLCFVVGLTLPYPYLPITRTIFLIPFGVIFASIAINEVRSPLIFVFIVGVIYTINIYQSKIGFFKQVGHNETTLIIRELMKEESTLRRNIVLVLPDKSDFNYTNIIFIKERYGITKTVFEVVRIKDFSCSKLGKKRVIFFSPEVEKRLILNKCKMDTIRI